MTKHKVIRCKCGNIVCVRHCNKIEIKKHGRTVSFDLNEGQTIQITCERCGGQTVLEGEEQ